MKLIKLALISFIILFLLITGISLFIPSTVRISRAVKINASKEQVMEQLSNPEKWKGFYPGADTLEIWTVNNEPKGIWFRKQEGQGLLITRKNDTSVVAENTGPGAKKIGMGWNIIHGDNATAVTLQWYMDFKLRWYPWEKFSSLLFEKRYGFQMEQGLNKLKKILENN